MKVIRILIILALVAGLIYVGGRFPLLVQNVDADIYEIFDRPNPEIPDFQQGSNQSDTGRTIVNGVPFSYAVEVVHASVPDVIEYYRKLYSPSAIRVFTDDQLKRAGVKEGDMAFKMIRNMETIAGHFLSPVFTQVGDTNGFLGVLDRGDNEKWFIKDPEKIWDEVVGKAVIAFKESPYQSETTVIRFWTTDGLDFRKLIPRAGVDSPGFDLKHIDRHPYATRMFSMAQEDGYGANQFAVYQVDDGVQGTLLYYLSDLRANGWAISDEVVQGAARSGYPNYLFASRGDRELDVYIDPSPDGGTVVTFHQKQIQ